MRILLAQINPTVGDLPRNVEKILKSIELAKQKSADLVLFPELCLSGYPPEDFLLLPHFIEALEERLEEIRIASKGITVIVGTPRQTHGHTEKKLYNSAAIFSNGTLIGFQDKALLPTYDVFSERRYFEPGSCGKIWNLCGKKVAITICEDIWEHSGALKDTTYLVDPVVELKKQSPDVVLNLSSSPYSTAKTRNRLSVCSKAAKAVRCPLLLCNQVGGNDGLIFDGHSLYVDAEGQLKGCAKGFEEDYLLVDLEKSVPSCEFHAEPTQELYQALVLGVHDYFQKLGFTKACLGISGGIDSALVACIARDAIGSENVLGLIMPSRYTSPESIRDAEQLAKNLHISTKTISIEQPFTSYLNLLEPMFQGMPMNETEENLQARIRGMILMAFSNKLGYIVLSTGNKSEFAMGYATLYGDMCGGLGVLTDVSKREIYKLAKWINRNKEIIPWNTIQRPPSAELKPNQKDTDTLPEYDIVDNVLQAYVEEHRSPEEICHNFGYQPKLVDDLIKRIHRNEYKRRQSPPGLRVTEKAFSVGRRFPIVQGWVK